MRRKPRAGRRRRAAGGAGRNGRGGWRAGRKGSRTGRTKKSEGVSGGGRRREGGRGRAQKQVLTYNVRGRERRPIPAPTPQVGHENVVREVRDDVHCNQGHPECRDAALPQGARQLHWAYAGAVGGIRGGVLFQSAVALQVRRDKNCVATSVSKKVFSQIIRGKKGAQEGGARRGRKKGTQEGGARRGRRAS